MLAVLCCLRRFVLFDVSSRTEPLSSKRPSVLPPLGGCPASCPDTYRLTHDHRHVRNWARVQIRLLTLLRNIFFRLAANLPNGCLRGVASRAHARAEDEQALSFSEAPSAARAPWRSDFSTSGSRTAEGGH